MLTLSLLLARLALAAVFLVAGLAKLADPAGSHRALRAFGVPRWLAAPSARLLPAAEIAVAVLLLPASTVPWAAGLALVLLLTFSAGIAVSLARGRTPDCHCFGGLHSRPASPATLGRNLGLAAVAGGVAWAGWDGQTGPSAVAWAVDAPGVALLVTSYALSAGLAVGLVALLRQNGRLLLRVEALEARLGLPDSPAPGELPIGAVAPTFRLPALDGDEASLGSLLGTGRPALLVFSDPACGPCRALLPEVARWQRDHAAHWTTVLVSRGDTETNAREARAHGLRHVLRQEDREVAEAFGCAGTPGAVLVGADGRIASPLLRGAEDVRAWVAKVSVGRPPHADAPAELAIGAPAPDLRLPMVDGPDVALADLRGAEALLVFWSPRCGYCQRMLPDLRALEADLADDPRAPRLLVVASGTAEDARALDLRSPVLLDAAFATGRAFGASGTPSAVRISADGRVASAVAVGAPAVLALAGRTQPAL